MEHVPKPIRSSLQQHLVQERVSLIKLSIFFCSCWTLDNKKPLLPFEYLLFKWNASCVHSKCLKKIPKTCLWIVVLVSLWEKSRTIQLVTYSPIFVFCGLPGAEDSFCFVLPCFWQSQMQIFDYNWSSEWTIGGIFILFSFSYFSQFLVRDHQTLKNKYSDLILVKQKAVAKILVSKGFGLNHL